MPYPFEDLVLEVTGDFTCNVTSKALGFLGTIDEPDVRLLRMSMSSMLDHLTEPRAVEEYVVEPNEKDNSGVWFLIRRYPGYEAVLGTISTEAGAKAILAYLQSNVRTEGAK